MNCVVSQEVSSRCRRAIAYLVNVVEAIVIHVKSLGRRGWDLRLNGAIILECIIKLWTAVSVVVGKGIIMKVEGVAFVITTA